MAGHSHWANIAHKKSVIDNKRGKLWSKLSKALIVAAKDGGGDPATNPKLRYAITDAKAGNMPKDTIEKAIKKGTGELEGGNLEQVLYEGYGPAGVAVLCEIYTDNRNRTASEVRAIFSKSGGAMGETGSVSFMFDRIGEIRVSAEAADGESLFEAAVEAGAEDVVTGEEEHEVICQPDALHAVAKELEQQFGEPKSAKLAWRPTSTVALDEDGAQSVFRMLEALDDNDDVQQVSANFEVADDVMARLNT